MEKAEVFAGMENCIARRIHESLGVLTEDGVAEYSMMASPNYHITGDRGLFYCDTFTYRICGRELSRESQELDRCQLFVKRIEAEFTITDEAVKLDQFEWQTIQSMVPWKYSDRVSSIRTSDITSNCMVLPVSSPGSSARDRIAIRNLQNYFLEKQMGTQMDLFSDKEEIIFYVEDYMLETVRGKENVETLLLNWAKAAALDQGRFVMQGVSGAPVIEITDDGNKAEALFLVETFGTNKIRKQDTLIRTIYQLKASYVREKNWKIVSMHMEKRADLPREAYTGGTRYDHMSQCPGVWIGGNYPMEGDYAQDIYEIETILSHWFYSCRRGELAQFYHKDMQNECFENSLHIKSQGEKSKKCIGEEQILERLGGMDAQYHPGQYSYHTATTPVIEISRDGLSARGSWFDQSATNLMNPTVEQDIIPYMVFVFRYIHEFKKVNGKWYLVHFYAKPLISMQDWEYDSKNTVGWVVKTDDTRYPLPKAEKGEVNE